MFSVSPKLYLMPLILVFAIPHLYSCADENPDLISTEKNRLQTLISEKKELDSKLTEAEQKQGLIKSMVWDNEEVNELQKQLDEIENNIKFSENRIVELKSSHSFISDWSIGKWMIAALIFAIIITPIVIFIQTPIAKLIFMCVSSLLFICTYIVVAVFNW